MIKKNEKRAFDPQAGEAAFKKIEPRLRSLAGDAIAIPNSDAQDSSIAALALVDIVREPKRRARLSLISKELTPENAVEELELAAWATWFAHTRMLSEAAGAGGPKVDASLYQESGQHLARMLKVLEYHVGEVPEVTLELAAIRSGTGYQDRASDLVRAATLLERYRSEVEGDERWFEAGDAARARSYAEQIIESLRSSVQARVAEWADLRNRAWTELSRWYGEVRAACEFVFRSERELFPPLRQAASPVRPRAALPEPDAASALEPKQPQD
jgi:hypothetical protein